MVAWEAKEKKKSNDIIMTTEEVAEFLKVHLSSVRRWSREGKLKGYRLGGSGDWRFTRDDVITFLKGDSYSGI
ncbi:MAG: helix-turn-helix domain-containing protein [Candidatus Helarchaeota archaeon]|nr:helix-turn-helix domain-containing protein [Candidatus Helarchaeota archaeon]